MESLWSHQQLGNVYSETTGKGSRLDRELVSTFQGNREKSSTLQVSMETSTSQLSPREARQRGLTYIALSFWSIFSCDILIQSYVLLME